MIDTLYIIKSHKNTLEQIMQMACGEYYWNDSRYKYFRYKLDIDNDKLDSLLIQFLDVYWTKKDIEQEILTIWHEHILNIYSDSRFNYARKKTSLEKSLFATGIRKITECIRSYFRDYCMRLKLYDDDIYYLEDTSKLYNISPWSFVMNQNGYSSSTRVFLYKFLVEQETLTDLKKKFGNSKTDEIVNEIKTIINH